MLEAEGCRRMNQREDEFATFGLILGIMIGALGSALLTPSFIFLAGSGTLAWWSLRRIYRERKARIGQRGEIDGSK